MGGKRILISDAEIRRWKTRIYPEAENRALFRLRTGTADVVCMEEEDLVLAARILMQQPDGCDPHAETTFQSFLITEKLRERFGMTKAELLQHAITNGRKMQGYRFLALGDAVAKITSGQETVAVPFTKGEDTVPPLREQLDEAAEKAKYNVPAIILTNTGMFYGAAALWDPEVRCLLEETFPEGIRLIPSSIHEWIILPDRWFDHAPGDKLREMVLSVNGDVSAIPPQIYLSDHIYRLKDRMLKIVG